MNMAPYTSGLRLSALVHVCCYAFLLSYTVLTTPSSAAEAIDKLIYREEFPAADKAAAWHVAYSGPKAPTVTIAREPTVAGGDAVAAKDGYLSIQPGEAGQTVLLWTEVKQWEVPQWSVPQFRWRQYFEKVATGSGNKPAMAHSLKPALRIGRTWHEALLGYDPPKEPGGKWEEASRWIDGELRWQQWKLDGDKLTPGKTVRWGGVERVALPNEAVTAFGLLFKIEAPARIGAFSIRVWRPQSPDVPPDANGAWPQFKRNAQRTGDSLDEDLLLPLRRIGGVKLPCPIYASPAVLEGVAIIQDAGGHVVCYDYRQRKIVWLAKLDGVANHSSPAIRDGRVYIGSCAGYLAILDAKNGRLLKKVPAEGGVISAPAITANGIYFTTFNGKLVKIDAEGNVIWTFGMGERSIVEFAVRGNEIAVCGGTQDHALFHVLDEGRSARQLNRMGLWQAHCGPAYGPHGRVALSGYMSEGSERYLYAFSRNHWVSVRHYGFSEWNSGDRDGQNNTRAVPSIANDRLYHGDICYDLNGREIWRTDWKASCIFGGGYQSSPAVTKNHVVIGGEDGKLYFFRSDPKLKSGEANKPEWSFTSEGAGKPNGAISSSPAVADGNVFVGGEDGVLYVLGQDEKRPVITAQVEAQVPQPAVARANNLEWPTIGGDMGYSWVSPDTTIKPPLQVKWKTRIWSTTKGPLIVAAGLVFTANRLGEVHALDADTGRIVWRYSHLGPESIPSPTYAEGKLLIFRCASQYVPRKESLGLWCHDAKTGNVLWHKPLVFAYHHPSDGLVAVNKKLFIPVHCNGITGAWGGVRPGDKMPQPGDIFLLHAGTYQGIRNNYRSAGGVRVWFEGTYYFVADGTPERPIVLKAAGDGEVIFDGDGCEALFDVTAADYIYLEGLTFRNARIAIRACNPRGGCAGLTVKRCKFENVGYGIRGEAEPSGDGTVYQEDYAIWKKPGFKVPRDFYIADNEVHGWRPKKSQAATLGGEQIDPECGDGIRLVGSGHVVCHNSVEGFWDNYGLHGYALDCYNNVSGVWPGGYADNACEADSSTRNVRFLRNRFDITAQPILGGPVYFIRNLGGPTKMIGGSDGVVAYHNTTGIISDFRGVPIDASDARFPSTTSTGQMLFLNNVVGTVNFGTHSLHTRFDYNAYGSGASWRYYSPTVQIMTKSFEEFREKTCHEEHGFHLAQGGNVVPGAALAPGSPLIDKACILPNVNDDFTGAGPDIGPYEFGKPLPHYGPRPIVPGSGTRK
jgi:outer membrane protein assembly factor BamB